MIGKNEKDFKVTSEMFESVLNTLLKNDTQKQIVLDCFSKGDNKCQSKR